MQGLKNVLDDALHEFNRIRVPEVEAKVIEQTGDGFKVFFSGSFCGTCGYYDYFEDLLYLLLDDYGVKTEISGIDHADEGDYVSFTTI